MLTEEEAKKKWCPMVRASSENDEPASNAFGIHRNPDYARCIGNDCAMWRWKEIVAKENSAVHEVGYCGLAGKPE